MQRVAVNFQPTFCLFEQSPIEACCKPLEVSPISSCPSPGTFSLAFNLSSYSGWICYSSCLTAAVWAISKEGLNFTISVKLWFAAFTGLVRRVASVWEDLVPELVLRTVHKQANSEIFVLALHLSR